MHSTARETANRANATHSTGPRSAAGKARSSQNATTTALTGRTILLPTDDATLYETHLRSYFRQFKPLTAYETGLVQSLADTDWRLQRIPHLLLALEAKGYNQFSDSFDSTDPIASQLQIEIESHIHYEKHFRNLHLQENRLHRRHEKDLAELRQVQKERDQQRARDLDTASKMHLAAEHDGETFDPAELGFEFSTHDVLCYLQGKRAAAIAREALLQPSRDLFTVSPVCKP